MIAPLITRLVHEAPARDAAVIRDLVAALRADGSPLALVIARVVELVDQGQVDPGIALPALAMAVATLEDPRLGEREHAAARYEIETLLPVPAQSRPAPIAAPDVPLIALSRGRRPRT